MKTSQPDTSVPYHRRIIMKALPWALSLGTYAPGNNTRLYDLKSSFPFFLCTILKRSKDFGVGVFSLANIVKSDIIYKDPTCYYALDVVGLPNAFLDVIMVGILPSADAVYCIP